jgi:hypothetical protein
MSEDKLTQNIYLHITHLFPELREGAFFHIPNGGKRAGREAKKLQGMGTYAGAADFMGFHKGRCFFLEVKTENGRQSPEQKAFQEKCKLENTPYYVVRNEQEAETAVKEILLKINALHSILKNN